MAAPVLLVSQLEKRFGELTPLAGLDMSVARGEVVALVGANGAGKTTLLRVIAGAVEPDAGDVLVDGVDVLRGGARARSRLGWVLGDEHSWYWRLSGRQNLELFGGLRGLSRADAGQRADRLLGEVGLADSGDRLVSGYSTGMKARLAWARARLGSPSLLLLDEPSRGLDARAENSLADWLRRRGDEAVVLVTHLPAEAAAADRVLIMRDGRIATQLPGPVTEAELRDSIRDLS